MNKRRKKYIKFNHETLYTKFLIKKLHYIQKELHAELNILHQSIFHQIRKILHETPTFLHKIFYTKLMELLGFRT